MNAPWYAVYLPLAGVYFVSLVAGWTVVQYAKLYLKSRRARMRNSQSIIWSAVASAAFGLLFNLMIDTDLKHAAGMALVLIVTAPTSWAALHSLVEWKWGRDCSLSMWMRAEQRSRDRVKRDAEARSDNGGDDVTVMDRTQIWLRGQ